MQRGMCVPVCVWGGCRGEFGVASVCCSRLQRAAPTGRSPFAAVPLDPFPPQAVVPIGLSPALCPFSSSLAYPDLPTSRSFPCPFPAWAVVPIGLAVGGGGGIT